MQAKVIPLPQRPWTWTQHDAGTALMYSHGLYVCWQIAPGASWKLDYNGQLIGGAMTLDNAQHLARSHADAMRRGLSGKPAGTILTDDLIDPPRAPEDEEPDIIGPNATGAVCGIMLAFLVTAIAGSIITGTMWIFTHIGGH